MSPSTIRVFSSKSESESESEHHRHTGAIVGGVVGGVVGLALLAAMLVWGYRRRLHKSQPSGARSLSDIEAAHEDEDDEMGGRIAGTSVGGGVISPYSLFKPDEGDIKRPLASVGHPKSLKTKVVGFEDRQNEKPHKTKHQYDPSSAALAKEGEISTPVAGRSSISHTHRLSVSNPDPGVEDIPRSGEKRSLQVAENAGAIDTGDTENPPAYDTLVGEGQRTTNVSGGEGKT
ncbi:hypothetical protein AAF712_013940 [Marasmius tenuissimus]|uniref:Uncharacterized protein n=1 Tax=Marasmius tenuissimus TaxID=585030 RepID=A0ABR2ZEV5_9AGAR